MHVGVHGVYKGCLGVCVCVCVVQKKQVITICQSVPQAPLKVESRYIDGENRIRTELEWNEKTKTCRLVRSFS